MVREDGSSSNFKLGRTSRRTGARSRAARSEALIEPIGRPESAWPSRPKGEHAAHSYDNEAERKDEVTYEQRCCVDCNFCCVSSTSVAVGAPIASQSAILAHSQGFERGDLDYS